jgi:hypothetical protein
MNIACLMLVDPQGNGMLNRTIIKYSSLREISYSNWEMLEIV